jgi:hypothetical protein
MGRGHPTGYEAARERGCLPRHLRRRGPGFTYNAHVYPALTSGDTWTLSCNVNSFDSRVSEARAHHRDPSIHKSRFVSFRLAESGTPRSSSAFTMQDPSDTTATATTESGGSRLSARDRFPSLDAPSAWGFHAEILDGTGTRGVPVPSWGPMTPRPINSSWDRLERWLAAHAPRTFASLPPAADQGAIDAAQALLGQRFPAELAEFLRRHDGSGHFDVLGAFQLMSTREIVSTRQFATRLEEETQREGRAVHFILRDGYALWHPNDLPFASNAGGSHWVL